MGNSAASVMNSTVPVQGADPGSSPRAALQCLPLHSAKDLVVRPIPSVVARQICERHHYLRSYPAGGLLNFGVLVGHQILGVAVLGVGPTNAHRFFAGASREEVLCLARFWLDDRLGRNSESRTLGIILRELRRHQHTIKALVAYSDPAAGHTGVIYRAAGLLYLGESEATPLLRLPDGSVRHGRSLGQSYGSHSLRYLGDCGLPLELVPQSRKFIYVALVDPRWRGRLTRPVLPYPKPGDVDAGS